MSLLNQRKGEKIVHDQSPRKNDARPCGDRNRGGSNEYPHSTFLSRDKENNVYPCKPQFYYIKVGFKVKIVKAYFRDGGLRFANHLQSDHLLLEMDRFKGLRWKSPLGIKRLILPEMGVTSRGMTLKSEGEKSFLYE